VGRLFAVVRLASILIAAVAVFILLRTPGPPPEEVVRQAFAAYKHAVLANDGAGAAALISNGTAEWYGRMQDLALHASKEETDALGPLEKIQVLGFRLRVPLDELRTMSGRQLFAYSVSHGWIARASMERAEFGTVVASDGTAVAQLLLSGKDTGQQYVFKREDGRWVFDQLATLEKGNAAIKTAAAQRGISEDQFVEFLVESTTHKKLGDDLWQPLLPRDTPAMGGTRP
jgi:hypothetical protein